MVLASIKMLARDTLPFLQVETGLIEKQAILCTYIICMIHGYCCHMGAVLANPWISVLALRVKTLSPWVPESLTNMKKRIQLLICSKLKNLQHSLKNCSSVFFTTWIVLTSNTPSSLFKKGWNQRAQGSDSEFNSSGCLHSTEISSRAIRKWRTYCDWLLCQNISAPG